MSTLPDPQPPSPVPDRTGPPKAVLFDLDGTLVDTAPDLGYAANCVRAEAGMEPLPLPVYRPVASSGARGLLKIALGLTPDDADYVQRRDSFLAHYRANLARASRLFPGLNELLLSCELRGIRWGVVTNKASWLAGPLMAELKLASRAACLIGADQVPQPKPAPDSLIFATQQLGLAPAQCVYVGDDKRDIDAAIAAKMPSIAAGWGYIGDSEIESWGADRIAQTVAELARMLD